MPDEPRWAHQFPPLVCTAISSAADRARVVSESLGLILNILTLQRLREAPNVGFETLQHGPRTRQLPGCVADGVIPRAWISLDGSLLLTESETTLAISDLSLQSAWAASATGGQLKGITWGSGVSCIDGARGRYERSRDTCGTGSALGRILS